MLPAARHAAATATGMPFHGFKAKVWASQFPGTAAAKSAGRVVASDKSKSKRVKESHLLKVAGAKVPMPREKTLSA